jgi:hypothetical protein
MEQPPRFFALAYRVSFVITETTEGGAFLNMVFLTTMLTTADVNIHALIAKYGIDIQIVRPEMTKFRMGPHCSSAETQVCHRSYIIAASHTPPST